MKLKCKLIPEGVLELEKHFLPAMEKLGKVCTLVFSPTKLSCIVREDEGPQGVFSLPTTTLFSAYNIKSNYGDKIALVFDISLLLRAIKTLNAHAADNIEATLCKRGIIMRNGNNNTNGHEEQTQSFLSFTSAGYTSQVTQDVPTQNVLGKIDIDNVNADIEGSIDRLQANHYLTIYPGEEEEKKKKKKKEEEEEVGEEEEEDVLISLSTSSSSSSSSRYLPVKPFPPSGSNASRILATIDKFKQISSSLNLAISVYGDLHLMAKSPAVELGVEFNQLGMYFSKTKANEPRMRTTEPDPRPGVQLEEDKEKKEASEVIVNHKHFVKALQCKLTEPKVILVGIPEARGFLSVVLVYAVSTEQPRSGIKFAMKLPVQCDEDDY